MKRKFPGLLGAAIFFALAACALRILARTVNGFADGFAQWGNAFMISTLGRFFGLFPFSAGELLLYAGILLVLIWLIRFIVKAVRKKEAGRYARRHLVILAFLASVVFFLFEAGEDVLFYRTEFAVTYGYGTGSYTTEELAATGRMLVSEVNQWAGKVDRDDSGLMKVSDHLSDRIRQRMQDFGEEYPYLSGWYPNPKGVLCSSLLSVTGFTGIFTAYTMEANYNREMPAYNLPFTMCHELSHLRGNMPEDEANFVAYLACTECDQPDIRYSGALLGWIYTSNELYKRSPETWSSIASQLDAKADADLEANTAFWNSYKGQVKDTAESLNDSYLKGHGQAEGVGSYDRVVDLIVSKYLKDGK